ncbi:MAG: hypothetical protein ACLQOO_24245, partial [Terriglobia bacterium]
EDINRVHSEPSRGSPAMPRSARASAGGYCYHVINRGNARAEVFHKEVSVRDYQVAARGATGGRLPGPRLRRHA